jgi:hypothetical protein
VLRAPFKGVLRPPQEGRPACHLDEVGSPP